MKLHIMAPFRTHFKLYDETVIYNPDEYTLFWNKTKEEIQSKDYGFKNVVFTHTTVGNSPSRSRFRNVDQNSLVKPIELIHLTGNPDDSQIKQIFDRVKTQLLKDMQHAESVSVDTESLVVKLYNNSVGVLELDVDVTDVLNEEYKIEDNLDLLQEFAVTLGEQLSQQLYKTKIETFLRALLSLHNSSQFIIHSLFDYKNAKSNKILVPESTPENYNIVVNWVTRTLMFESADKNNVSRIVKHWLKDCGDEDMIEGAMQADKCAYRWLNYLFREDSYGRGLNADGTIDYTQPFSDVWDAMLISQYYYCAFEALNDLLEITLATAFLSYKRKDNKHKNKLKDINRKLDREIIDSHELLIEYKKNFAYYKRSVGLYIKEILTGWDFEDAILSQVVSKIELCEQRMGILHHKATEKSSLYTDLLLLSIAVISVIAFMFQVIEYGRNISHDADLAVYESNSVNLVNLLSERPTDFAITISLGLMIIIFIIYYIFRRDKVLD
ncbi:hypothetical protein [Plebeiibacterium marinum]|uniref:Uncharacterized protein n=1 Tax=Plebeiibacterium marinum TaxID=2992111 RepID=A0AAE3SMU2_9BACT|nr:hypothetical protein [Plebeiobacterium marinum]MCW3807910.1 hypothetical protein [Plebeiobacterium marinum]